MVQQQSTQIQQQAAAVAQAQAAVKADAATVAAAQQAIAATTATTQRAGWAANTTVSSYGEIGYTPSDQAGRRVQHRRPARRHRHAAPLRRQDEDGRRVGMGTRHHVVGRQRRIGGRTAVGRARVRQRHQGPRRPVPDARGPAQPEPRADGLLRRLSSGHRHQDHPQHLARGGPGREHRPRQRPEPGRRDHHRPEPGQLGRRLHRGPRSRPAAVDPRRRPVRRRAHVRHGRGAELARRSRPVGRRLGGVRQHRPEPVRLRRQRRQAVHGRRPRALPARRPRPGGRSHPRPDQRRDALQPGTVDRRLRVADAGAAPVLRRLRAGRVQHRRWRATTS